MYQHSEYSFNKSEDEGMIKYYVKILSAGKAVEVNEDVYNELLRSTWREDKANQRRSENHLSLEYEYEQGDCTLCNYISSELAEPENILLRQEEQQQLRIAFSKLTEEEQELLTSLVLRDIPIRTYADSIGKPHSTIHYRKQKALEKFKKYLMEIL